MANGGAVPHHVADDTSVSATIGAQIRATETLGVGAAAIWNRDNLPFGTGAHNRVGGAKILIFGAYNPAESNVYSPVVANFAY